MKTIAEVQASLQDIASPGYVRYPDKATVGGGPALIAHKFANAKW